MERKKIKSEQAARYRLHYFHKEGVPELTEDELQQESDLIFKSLMEKQAGMKVRKAASFRVSRLWYSSVAAAAVITIAAAVYLFNYTRQNPVKSDIPVALKHEPAPGTHAATLTLADGQKIILANVAMGPVASQTGVSITKTADGKLVYTIKDLRTNLNNITKELNTLSTVNGQQYQVILPDGTRVWLNAASSVTYPVNFANLKTRNVRLSGEAYFEVAKDKRHPFIVKTDKQQVEVLGTHFNINSYDDEKGIKTTLLEGSVRVSGNKGEKVLLPGQQSLLTQSKLSISKVDVNGAVAWKNGDFIFDNQDFASILRQISRWYNVEIIDNGNHGELHLGGTISRSKSMSTVLKALEVTGKVKFKIEGKKVIVIQ